MNMKKEQQGLLLFHVFRYKIFICYNLTKIQIGKKGNVILEYRQYTKRLFFSIIEKNRVDDVENVKCYLYETGGNDEKSCY